MGLDDFLDARPATPADLASRLGWLPCEECGQTGIDGSTFVSATWLEPSQAEPCPSCNGIGWLPSSAVLEAMARALHERDKVTRPGPAHLETWDSMPDQPGTHDFYFDLARAAWEAQARLILEGER